MTANFGALQKVMKGEFNGAHRFGKRDSKTCSTCTLFDVDLETGEVRCSEQDLDNQVVSLAMKNSKRYGCDAHGAFTLEARSSGTPKAHRRQKTTRADIQAGNCEAMPWQALGRVAGGKIKARCPFCGFTLYLTPFSLAGNGKRCLNPFCFAMLREGNKAYRKKADK